MKKWTKRLLAALLTAALVSAPALAAGEQAPQQISPWAYSELADSYALGLMDDDYGTYIQSPVTVEQLAGMTAVVADKLALLGAPVRQSDAGAALVVDGTRGGVINALYQEVAAYEFPGVEQGPVGCLTELGVVKGVNAQGALSLEQTCTYQEAMVLAKRVILSLYDLQDAGSRGLLWKAVHGDNTLYLLGTIHLDRDNVYPLHKSVRDAIDVSDTVLFEVNFNDVEGMAAFQAMQTYSDGTGLRDHISPELYARTVEALAALGMTEEQVNAYKPWTLAAIFTQMSLQDDTTGVNAMAIDLYVNSRGVNSGKEIGEVESAAFQGELFDSLSPDYQEDYLAATLGAYEAGLEGGAPSEEEQQAAQENQYIMAAMFDAWKQGDAEAFSRTFQKQAVVDSEDELNSRLFTDRDPGMIAAAAACLENGEGETFFLAVGAGHMVDPGGIVSGLRALGYTVEPVK